MKVVEIILSVLLLSAAAAKEEKEYDPRDCDQDLMSAFGMTGLERFEYNMVEMCPEVRRNCCTKEDQLQMYTNWVQAGEGKKVNRTYEALAKNYTALVDRLEEVHKFAVNVVSRLAAKKVANCKILAERIINFDIVTVGPIIRENLKKMQKFWAQAFSGWYCSVCDHDNHKYVNATEGKIYFSNKFCRDIVENNLPTLVYFHSHFVKYLNLVTKFVSSCDFKGEFNLDAVVSANLTFTVDEEVKKDLLECRDYRNMRDWFVYCKDICENFDLGEFSDYFEPNREQYLDYIEYLDEQLEVVRFEEQRNPLLATPPPAQNTTGQGQNAQGQSAPKKKKSVRLLQGESKSGDNKSGDNKSGEKKPEGGQNGGQNGGQAEPEDPDARIPFKPAQGAKMNVGDLETTFIENGGFNLYEVGEKQQMTEGIFNQLKTLVTMKKLKESGAKMTEEQAQLAKKVGK